MESQKSERKKWLELVEFYENLLIANKYVNRCLISLIIKKIKTKTTMRYFCYYQNGYNKKKRETIPR